MMRHNFYNEAHVPVNIDREGQQKFSIPKKTYNLLLYGYFKKILNGL